MSVENHINTLLQDAKAMRQAPLPQIRENIANKVTNFYNSGVFEEKELEIANEIIRLLAQDAEIRVRKIISENLKSSSNLPRDVAVKLANDVLEVALPVLEFSKVLSDQDLTRIIQSTREVARLRAITRRKDVSELVSGELIRTRQEEVVTSLLKNGTSNISENSLFDVITHFKQHGRVIESMVHRAGLPIGIAEKLVAHVSGSFRQKLLRDYQIPERKVQEIIDSAREQATLGLLKQGRGDALAGSAVMGEKKAPDPIPTMNSFPAKPVASPKERQAEVPQYRNLAEELVRHLHDNDRLTHSIVLRSICEGNLSFFEAGMARIAGISVANAHKLIMDSNPLAFRSLYEKSHMPQSTFNAVHVILQQALHEAREGTLEDGGFKRRLVEYIIESGFDRTIPLMKYMMVLVASDLRTADIVH
jgi:uncharacterized protein (DUF2336 family)